MLARFRPDHLGDPTPSAAVEPGSLCATNPKLKPELAILLRRFMKTYLVILLASLQFSLAALADSQPPPAPSTNSPPGPVAPSTLEMARQLERIGARFDDDLIAQRPDMHLARFVLSHGEDIA